MAKLIGIELDFHILYAGQYSWQQMERVAQEFIEAHEGVTHQDFESRIDFLHNRNCIKMRWPRRKPRNILNPYIALDPSVPNTISELAELVEALHAKKTK